MTGSWYLVSYVSDPVCGYTWASTISTRLMMVNRQLLFIGTTACTFYGKADL